MANETQIIDITDIDFDDDQLIDDDFFDDSLLILEEEKPMPRYLNSEELMIMPYNLNADFFVLKPKKNNFEIQKTGYMIKQYKQKEQLIIHQMFFEYDTVIKYNNLSISNYINNYTLILKDFNNTNDLKLKYLCLLKIYKLLCNTFIHKISQDNSCLGYKIKK